MIALTIILGVAMLLCARAVDLTQTWIGTAAASAVILLLVMAALPSAWWLFDDLIGWVTSLALWAITTVLYYALLHDPAPAHVAQRRSTPIIELRQPRIIHFQIGRYAFGFAMAVTA